MRNVEIKARIDDLDALRVRIAGLGARFVETLRQVDRYYELAGGRRVKLRSFGDGAAEMIYYDRPEDAAVRTSSYEIRPVRDAEARSCLVPKQEPIAVVRKVRELHVLDNVRFHLDTVDELGTFLELEAVVDAAHDEPACREQIAGILRALGIREEQCLRTSYGDMIAGT